jgi:hypothetical protein
MLPSKRDFNRKTKNDEFDGNHMTDDRTEKVTEWPGRTHEKPVSKAATPDQMLRFEQKRQAQGQDDPNALPPEPEELDLAGVGKSLPPEPEEIDLVGVGKSDEDNYRKSQQVGTQMPGEMGGSTGIPSRAPATGSDPMAPAGLDGLPGEPDGGLMGGMSDTPEVLVEDPDTGAYVKLIPQDLTLAAKKWASRSAKRQANLKRYAMEELEEDLFEDDLEVSVVELDTDTDDDMMGDDSDSDKVCEMLENMCDLIDDPKCKSVIEKACSELKGDSDDDNGDEPDGMMKYTSDDDEFEGMGSMASYAEYTGRRVAKFADYLVRKGQIVTGFKCYCKAGTRESQRCLDYGCSNNPSCNTSRGLALIMAEKAGKADNLTSKSNPTPDVDDKSRPMDGMHKRDDGGGEKVVPSERGKAESEVRKAQTFVDPNPTEISFDYTGDPTVGGNQQLYNDLGMVGQTSVDPNALEQSLQVSPEALMQSMQESAPIRMDPSVQDYKHYRAMKDLREAIVTTGTPNDPPTVKDESREMDGMHNRSGNESKKVIPSEEAGDDQVVPGITKNNKEDVTDDSDLDDTDGMTRNKKYTPKSNAESTKREAGHMTEEEKELLKSKLSGPEKVRPNMRIYASKKQTLDSQFQAKLKEIKSQWGAGHLTIREAKARENVLVEAYKKKLAQLSKSSSKMGREDIGGGENADKEKGYEKYHQDSTLKNKSEFKDQEWVNRSKEKTPWKSGGSQNYHPTLKGDEGKERSDESDDSNKWAGRTREKNPSGDEKLTVQTDSKGLTVKKDEGKSRSDETEKPDKWAGRSREKGKSPSKDPASYMYKDSTNKRESNIGCYGEKDEDKEEKKEEIKDDKESGDSKKGMGAFINASLARKRRLHKKQAVDGGGKETSYNKEGKDDVSKEMPGYEYKADKEKGRSDEEGEIKDFKKKQPTVKSEEVDEKFKSDGEYLKKSSKKKVTALDHDRVSTQTRRHKIDQHMGRVDHVGHPFKGNDICYSANETALQDIRDGRKPNSKSPMPVEYFAERAARGLSTRDYLDSNHAYKCIVYSEEARWMSDFQKMRLAESMKAYGLTVDDEIVEKCIKEGNFFNKAQRAEEETITKE